MEEYIFLLKHQWDCPTAYNPGRKCWTYAKKLDSIILTWQSACTFTIVAIYLVTFIILVCAAKRLKSKFSNLGRFFLAVICFELFMTIPFNLTPYTATTPPGDVMEVELTRHQEFLVMSAPTWRLWDQPTKIYEDCRTKLTGSCYCNETVKLINSVDEQMNKHINLKYHAISLVPYRCMMTALYEIDIHTKAMSLKVLGRSFTLLILSFVQLSFLVLAILRFGVTSFTVQQDDEMPDDLDDKLIVI